MIFAKQSTAIIVTVGPVLDADGVAVTGGVVGDFKISKNGGAPAALNGSATLTHRNTGHYSLSLTATDVNTVGTAEIVIDDTTNACPIKEIQVVEGTTYDVLFADSAPGPASPTNITAGTITTATNVTTVNGLAANVITATSINADAITAAKVASDVTTEIWAGSTAPSAATIAAAVWDLDATAHQTQGTFGQAIGDPVADTNTIYKAVVSDATGATVGVDVVAIKAETVNILADTAEIGTAGAGLTNINLPNQTMDIVGNVTGNLSGSVGSVTGAVGSVTGAVGSVTGNVGGNVTGTIGGLTAAALKDFFDTDSTTTYASAVAGSVVKEIVTNVASGSGLDAAGVRAAIGLASANLDTQLGDLPTNAELTTALGTADDAVLAAIAALNNLSQANIRTAVGLASANLDTQLADLPTNSELSTALAAADDATLAAIAALNNLSAAQVNAEVDTALGDYDGPTNAELATALAAADDAVLAAIAALNNLSASQVNAEMVDALATDTYAEPGQGSPGATISLAGKVNYLYKSWRNKKEGDGTYNYFYADNGTTVDHKQTVGESAGTVTKGEIVTGP